jgi:hypothetical protein
METIINDYISTTYKVRKIKLGADKKFTRCIELRTNDYHRLNRNDRTHIDNMIAIDLSEIFGISKNDALNYTKKIRF